MSRLLPIFYQNILIHYHISNPCTRYCSYVNTTLVNCELKITFDLTCILALATSAQSKIFEPHICLDVFLHIKLCKVPPFMYSA